MERVGILEAFQRLNDMQGEVFNQRVELWDGRVSIEFGVLIFREGVAVPDVHSATSGPIGTNVEPSIFLRECEDVCRALKHDIDICIYDVENSPTKIVFKPCAKVR